MKSTIQNIEVVAKFAMKLSDIIELIRCMEKSNARYLARSFTFLLASFLDT